MMIGRSRITGELLDDIDHTRQSIKDILSTPKGSRVMVREYGSDLYKYRDYPINNDTIAKIYNAVAVAIDTWEPRVSLSSGNLDVQTDNTGLLSIGVEFIYKPNGQRYSLGDERVFL